MDLLFAKLGGDHILQHLEVLGDSSLVSLRTALQLDDGTDGLTVFVDHLESIRHLSHLQRIDDTRHVLRQVLHTEPRGVGLRIDAVGHQSAVAAGVLVIREKHHGILKCPLADELVLYGFGRNSCTNVVGDGVETHETGGDGRVADLRLQEDMTGIDLIAALVDKLDDMETEFGFHNL